MHIHEQTLHYTADHIVTCMAIQSQRSGTRYSPYIMFVTQTHSTERHQASYLDEIL